MYSFVSVLVPEGQDVENYSPLMVCDFSAVENKTFTNADTIYLPVTVYDQLAMKTAEKGFVSVTQGPKNNETTQNKTITYNYRFHDFASGGRLGTFQTGRNGSAKRMG